MADEELTRRLLEQFKAVDCKGDGTISESDLVNALSVVGFLHGEEVVQASGSTDGGRVNYNQFLSFVLGACPVRKPTRKALHRVDRELQVISQTNLARIPSSLQRKQNATYVVRVVLTGGPCGGKSSALEHITAACKEKGFDTYCAPEIATVIFNSGFKLPAPDKPEESLTFQIALQRMQLQMERSMTKIAEATGRPSVLVFDRGLLDSKCFISEAGWQSVLEQIGAGDHNGGQCKTSGVTEEVLLDRYDAVLHLVTAADGAEQFYKHGTTVDDAGRAVVRKSTPEQARNLDQKLLDVWKSHPRQHVFRNEGTFKDKMGAVCTAILKVASDKHPIDSVSSDA